MGPLLRDFLEYGPYLMVAIAIIAATTYLIKPEKPKVKVPAKTQKPLSEREKLTNQINTIRKKADDMVKDLYPTYHSKVEAFLAEYLTSQPENPKFVKDKAELEGIHAKIGELLLIHLISLDSVECTHIPDIRLERKSLIKYLQTRINSADQDWARVKEL